MAQVGLTFMLDDSAQSHMDEVAHSLERRGVRVRQVLPHPGAILGVGDESLIDDIGPVSGVEMVRRDLSFTLPVMDESVPQ